MSIQSLNELFRRKVFMRFPHLPSTHQFAIDYVAKNEPSKIIVISTAYQTDGVGQYDRKWHSEAGKSLNLSLLIPLATLKLDELSAMPLLAALAVADAIEEMTSQEAKIKWPNDIICKGKKVAGILLHAQHKGKTPELLICSFGVNFDVDFPDTLSFAGNLMDFMKKDNREHLASDVRPEDLIPIILKYLKLHFETYMRNDISQIRNLYEKRLYKLGEKAHFAYKNEKKISGTIMGVDHRFRLLLNLDGTLKKYNDKELKYCYE